MHIKAKHSKGMREKKQCRGNAYNSCAPTHQYATQIPNNQNKQRKREMTGYKRYDAAMLDEMR
jgi:hypothetical protein